MILESQNIFDLFRSVRNRTLELSAPLQQEDYGLQTDIFVSPVKWHLAHTTWFFEEFILSTFPDYKIFDPAFQYLFNSYYNHIGERVARDKRGTISRPSVEEVLAYRQHVDMAMDRFTAQCNDKLLELIILGINHEQQHQELLITDLKFNLFQNPLQPVYHSERRELERAIIPEGWINLKEGIYEIGHTGEGFCFDNELGRHRVFLESVRLSSDLVTNGEYLEFIEDGGYDRFELWLDEGWEWSKQSKGHPLYWKKHDGGWLQFTLAGMRPIENNAALAHINYYEADAFARWKGCRLPSEFEWEAASELFNWGERWEWTQSAYLPYPKYKAAPGAVGEYNGKFMVNQMILRGSSIVTPAGHSRKTYRNFFHPHLSWQFTGIRLAQDS
jgi:ergothioneine biosynthesis protein EgtB